MKKKLCIFTFVIVLILQTTVSYGADIRMDEAINLEAPNLVIDSNDLNLSNSQIAEYEDAADALARELKDANPSEFVKIIQTETSNLDVTEAITQVTEYYIEETGETPNVIIDYDEMVQTYQLDGDTSLEVTPLYIAIEQFTLSEQPAESTTETLVSKILKLLVEEANAATVVKSVGGRSTKTFYALKYGYKLFTISVGMYFNYDGSKAWYKSDFDAYWIKHLGGTLFQVNDWNEKKEVSGTAYQGWCSGVFGEGIVLNGNMISLMNSYIKVKVSCSKDGAITRTYESR